MIFNTLPVDMTFVDENNKVRFFSRPKDRIFPRSAAIIGRDVKNCHPPESVHVVEEIIDGFRSGERESAQFWIDIKGKKLLIQYFALRNSNGRYQGTLEVSQDITEIQKIEGQKRLLEWDSNK
jgi:PAS domain S-box-containing protein